MSRREERWDQVDAYLIETFVPGDEAFAAASQSIKNVRFEGSYDIRELKVLGDWAFLRNYLTLTVTPPGGKPMRRAGWTLTILRKTDGKWQLARDANLMSEVP